METEILFESRVLGRTFTQEEWSEWCKANCNNGASEYDSQDGHGYKWNINDVCLNPERVESEQQAQTYFKAWAVKVASFRGRWYCGTSLEANGGDFSCYGQGGGCCIEGDGYDTKNEAIMAGIEYLRTKCAKYFNQATINELKGYNKPKHEYKQLTIFDVL